MKIRPLKIFEHTLQELWLKPLPWARILFAPSLVLFAVLVLFPSISYKMKSEWTKSSNGTVSQEKTTKVVATVPLLISLVSGHEREYEMKGPMNWTVLGILLVISLLGGTLFFLASGQMAINGYRYVLLEEGGTSWWTLPFNRRLVKMIVYSLIWRVPFYLLMALVWAIIYFCDVLHTAALLYYIPLSGGGDVCSLQ